MNKKEKKLKKINNNLLNNYLNKIKKINELEICKGKIIDIIDDYVIIDFKYKYEGIISLNEFKDKKKKIKIGDKKKFMIIKLDYNGNCLLSYEKANILKSWIKIENAYKNNKILKGYIISRTKGGFIINLYKNIPSFLPGSHTDIKAIKDYDYYVGKTINVKILKINYKKKNIIVSHKILIEKDIENKKQKLISTLQVGQIIEGKVKSLISYGAFIDLGNIDGLLHITDISWKKTINASDILKVGEKYNFLILEIDKKKLKIQLGLKQLTTNPWDLFKDKIKIGDIIKGNITSITDYGAFVEIKEGIEGLLHVSEMTWDNQLKSAKNFVKLNDKIKCLIINIDKENKKIFLSLKRLKKDPWIKKIKKYTINSKHKGKIIEILKNNYGLKIELEKNIYGILYNKEISWYSNIDNLSSIYKIGDKIKVVILSLDLKMRKIILGHKQLEKNKWDDYKKIYKVNSINYGNVVNIYKNGILLKNKKNNILNFFIPSKFRNKKIYKVGEEIKFKIKKINIDSKIILVYPILKNKYYNKKYIKNISTFGDLDELNILKKKIEKEEKEKNKI
ncbi:MAG: S1 RNA-binding domain-containing protein [Candidatus Shikimatogenerans bostrichidophilus]|nr:MAG: S1 RNA-binding domain-containing protein [Candidatus Shikimatogenerans bostrichidophilus]